MCFHREYQSALLCPFYTPRQFLQRTPIGIPVCLSRKRYAGQTGNVPASCRARILHQPAKLRTLFCPYLWGRVVCRARLKIKRALQKDIRNGDPRIFCFAPERRAARRRRVKLPGRPQVGPFFKQPDVDPVKPHHSNQFQHIPVGEQRKRKIRARIPIFHFAGLLTLLLIFFLFFFAPAALVSAIFARTIAYALFKYQLKSTQRANPAAFPFSLHLFLLSHIWHCRYP